MSKEKPPEASSSLVFCTASFGIPYPCFNFNTPPSPFCHHCYDQQILSPPTRFILPSSRSSCLCYDSKTWFVKPRTLSYKSLPSISAQQMQQKISPRRKITRTHYSNKHRYMLNEIFKQTPYPNGIQRDLIARRLNIRHEQVRIWFQNRRRVQVQRDSGERVVTVNEVVALQQGKTTADMCELKTLLDDVDRFKTLQSKHRLDESS